MDLISRLDARDAALLPVDGYWKAKNYGRAADLIDPSLNPSAFDEYAWAYTEHPRPEGLRYSLFEASWAEQRGHLDRALAALTPERRAIALLALEACRPPQDAGDIGQPIDVTAEHLAGRIIVPHPAMPSVSLTAQDSRDLVAYIITLKRND